MLFERSTNPRCTSYTIEANKFLFVAGFCYISNMLVKTMTNQQLLEEGLRDIIYINNIKKRHVFNKEANTRKRKGLDPWCIRKTPHNNRWHTLYSKDRVICFAMFNGLVLFPGDTHIIRTYHFFERYNERVLNNKFASIVEICKYYLEYEEFLGFNENITVLTKPEDERLVAKQCVRVTSGGEMGKVVKISEHFHYYIMNTFYSNEMLKNEPIVTF